jgi:N-hydroxyarylamine O-acetyltransferase
VPYEDLAVQLGQSARLDEQSLVQRVLRGGRGGYCFEANTVFRALLVSLGFEVSLREGVVGEREDRSQGSPTNHMAMVVHTVACEPYIADAGLGEGPLDPLPLQAGTVVHGGFRFTIERLPDGWWVGADHSFASIRGFSFSDRSVGLEAFQPHHHRLSTAPESSFVQTLVVQRPFDSGVITLRARTLSVDGPDRRERSVLADLEALGAALDEHFGIDPAALGSAALQRLWSQAVVQHEAHERQRRD